MFKKDVNISSYLVANLTKSFVEYCWEMLTENESLTTRVKGGGASVHNIRGTTNNHSSTPAFNSGCGYNRPSG